MAANPKILGGLDLAALAQGGVTESTLRAQGSEQQMASYLASMLAEQRGLLGSQEEAQERDLVFQAAQQALEHALARREADLQEAAARARMAFEAQQAHLDRKTRASIAAADRAASGSAADDWYARQIFQTDENIRQAMALAALEEEMSKPRLSDFGNQEINAYRGEALANSGYKPGGGGKGLFGRVAAATRPLIDRAAVQYAVEKYGNDPSVLSAALRRYAPGRSKELSYALYDLGYGR